MRDFQERGNVECANGCATLSSRACEAKQATRPEPPQPDAAAIASTCQSGRRTGSAGVAARHVQRHQVCDRDWDERESVA